MTVTQRQHLLAYLGYYVGTIDSDWGSLSREACRRFQQDFGGIAADGFGGPETDKALKHAVAMGFLKRKEPEVSETGVSNNGTSTPNDETFWVEIEFFDREEFRCQCGGKYCNGFPNEPHEATVRFADAIRRRLGKPIRVNSGLRCPTWNSIQGGVANSDHCKGKALDFSIEGMSGSQLLYLAQSDPRTRYAYIIDGGWVHVDVE